MSKVLDRVVASQLANLALKYRLSHTLHFDPTSMQSAVDVAETFTYDVEKAFQDIEEISALAFDIEGAFDRWTNARLVKRLWEQDIFFTIIKWIASFLNNFTAVLRLDGKTEDQESVKIGVLQGSPFTLILFMLFTGLLFKIPTQEDKNAKVKIRGYVDDGFLTSKG